MTGESAALPVVDRAAAIRSVRWSTVSVVAQQVGRVLVSLVLARLLGPADYGVVAQAGIYLALMAVLLDQGLGSALIQRLVLEPGDVGTVIWVNVVGGIIVTIATIVGAPGLALLFHTPGLTAVLRVLSIDVMLTAVSVVPQALLMRDLRFKRLAAIEISGMAMGGICAIAAGIGGLRYWSLVVLVLSQDTLLLVLLLLAAGRLELHASRARWRQLRSFSMNLLGFQLLNFASRNLDNVVVGNRLGRAQLADYALSYRTMMQPIQMLGWLVNRVAFPIYSTLQHDVVALKRQFLRSSRVVGLVTFPTMSLVIVVAPRLVPAVFGEAWRPAVAPMQILAITGMRQSVLTLVGPVFMARGRTDSLFRWQILSVTVYVTSFLIGVHWGIVGVAAGYGIAGLLLMPGELWLLSKTVPFSAGEYLRELVPPLVVGSIAAAAGLVMINGLDSASGLIAVAAASVASVVAAVTATRLLFASSFEEIWELAQSVARPSRTAAV